MKGINAVTVRKLTLSLAIFALSILIGAASDGTAARKTIMGRVTKIAETMIEVRTKNAQTVSVKLDAGTKYMKWITQKPWQQSTHASARFLGLGKLVSVEVREDDPCVARLVRIATLERLVRVTEGG